MRLCALLRFEIGSMPILRFAKTEASDRCSRCSIPFDLGESAIVLSSLFLAMVSLTFWAARGLAVFQGWRPIPRHSYRTSHQQATAMARRYRRGSAWYDWRPHRNSVALKHILMIINVRLQNSRHMGREVLRRLVLCISQRSAGRVFRKLAWIRRWYHRIWYVANSS